MAHAPLREMAARFRVSASYVSKGRARQRTLSLATPGAQRNHVPAQLAGLHDVLPAQVKADCDTTLAELRTWVAAERNVAVSGKVMWKTVRRLGLTLKKSRGTQPSRRARTWPRRGQPGERPSPS